MHVLVLKFVTPNSNYGQLKNASKLLLFFTANILFWWVVYKPLAVVSMNPFFPLSFHADTHQILGSESITGRSDWK